MRQWVSKVLRRIRKLARDRQVWFTLKARREIATLGIGLDERDACEVLAELGPEDSAGRIRSMATQEWMYVFKPELSGTTLYVKLLLREQCLVVSFHADEGESNDGE